MTCCRAKSKQASSRICVSCLVAFGFASHAAVHTRDAAASGGSLAWTLLPTSPVGSKPAAVQSSSSRPSHCCCRAQLFAQQAGLDSSWAGRPAGQGDLPGCPATAGPRSGGCLSSAGAREQPAGWDWGGSSAWLSAGKGPSLAPNKSRACCVLQRISVCRLQLPQGTRQQGSTAWQHDKCSAC